MKVFDVGMIAVFDTNNAMENSEQAHFKAEDD
jgi:hypothetical protein